MTKFNRPHWRQTSARWAGVLIGIGAGWVYFKNSVGIFAGEPGPTTWLGFINVIARFLAQFLLLAASVVGAFRPRFSAYWIAASFSLAGVLTFRHIVLFQYVSISGLASFCLYWLVVPWAIAGLFFYSCVGARAAGGASTNGRAAVSREKS